MCFWIQMSEIASSTCLIMNQRDDWRAGLPLVLSSFDASIHQFSGSVAFKHFDSSISPKRVLEYCELSQTFYVLIWNNHRFTSKKYYKVILYNLYRHSLSGDILQNHSTVSQPRCRHWYSQDTEPFYHHEDPSCCPFTATSTSLPALLPPFPVATINPVSISIISSFQEYCISGIIQYVTFGNWLFSPSIILWRLIQVVLYINSLAIRPLKNMQFVSQLWLLWIKLQNKNKNKYKKTSFSLKTRLHLSGVSD